MPTWEALRNRYKGKPVRPTPVLSATEAAIVAHGVQTSTSAAAVLDATGQLYESFRALGMSEAEARSAAIGRDGALGDAIRAGESRQGALRESAGAGASSGAAGGSDAIHKGLEESFRAMGMSEAAAAEAARGRGW